MMTFLFMQLTNNSKYINPNKTSGNNGSLCVTVQKGAEILKN